MGWFEKIEQVVVFCESMNYTSGYCPVTVDRYVIQRIWFFLSLLLVVVILCLSVIF